MNINRIVVTGNLVKDPDTTALTSGTLKCSFRLAVNGRNEHVDYFNVVLFGVLAEHCGKYLKKGNKIGLSGRLSTRDFQGKDGQKKTVYEIIADDVEFLNFPRTEEKDEKPQEFKQEKMGGLPPVDPVNEDDLPF